MFERWCPVIGYEQHYEVSDLGRVRRVAAGRGATVGRILRHRKQGKYLCVQLCKDDTKKKIDVHILVTEAFYGPRPDGKVPNHKDLDKHNNRADNLEWLTRKENAQHAIANGAKGGRSLPGEKNGRAKLTTIQVEEIRQLKGSLGTREIAKRFGVARSLIQRIHQGRAWRVSEEWPEDVRVREFPEVVR